MTDSKNTTDTGETLPGVDVSDWPETADVTHDVPDWLIPNRVYDTPQMARPHRPARTRRIRRARSAPHGTGLTWTR